MVNPYEDYYPHTRLLHVLLMKEVETRQNPKEHSQYGFLQSKK